MKKTLILSVFWGLCFSSVMGMEKGQKNKRILPLFYVEPVELPIIIQNPRYVSFLRNNMIALANNHECIVYNYKTNDTVKIGSALAVRDLVRDCYKDRIALLSYGRLIQYNIETKKKESRQVSLTHTNITFFMDSNDDQGIWYLSQEGTGAEQASIACHPYKKEVLVTTSYKDIQKLCFVDRNNQRKEENIWKAHCLLSADYSPGGTYVVAMDKRIGCLICKSQAMYNVSSLTKNTAKFDKPKYAFSDTVRHVASAFHSDTVLAVLTHKNRLEYWNIEKSFLLVRILLSTIDSLEETQFVEKRLSFSPDGKLLCLALKNKVLLLKVPFEAFFPVGTKDKLWQLFCAFKLYEYLELPTDIFFVIMQHYLEIAKNLDHT